MTLKNLFISTVAEEYPDLEIPVASWVEQHEEGLCNSMIELQSEYTEFSDIVPDVEPGLQKVKHDVIKGIIDNMR